MTDGDLLLLVELAAPLLIVGVIWAVQILNYAPMRLVGWAGRNRPSQVNQEDGGI